MNSRAEVRTPESILRARQEFPAKRSNEGSGRMRLGADAPPVEIRIRAMNVDDAGFILDSWCGSYAKSPVVGPIDNDLFKIEQRNRVYRLIPKCRVLVACNPQDTKSIRGWIAAEAPSAPEGLWTLHYVLTRYELQGQGIASALVANFRAISPGSQMWATHWTPALKWFGKDKETKEQWLMFNPYLLEV